MLADFQPQRAKAIVGETCAEKAEHRELTAAALRASFEVEATARDRRLAGELTKLLQNEGQQRKANMDWVFALDHQLFQVLGVELGYFAAPRRLGLLCNGEKRLTSMQVPGELDRRARSVIVQVDGVQYFEVGLKMVDGKRHLPALHLSSDMGPVGLPAQHWLLKHVGLRATCIFDILPRLHGDLWGATGATGLLVVRLDYMQVCKIRKGPFRPGGRNLAAPQQRSSST